MDSFRDSKNNKKRRIVDGKTNKQHIVKRTKIPKDEADSSSDYDNNSALFETMKQNVTNKKHNKNITNKSTQNLTDASESDKLKSSLSESEPSEEESFNSVSQNLSQDKYTKRLKVLKKANTDTKDYHNSDLKRIDSSKGSDKHKLKSSKERSRKVMEDKRVINEDSDHSSDAEELPEWDDVESDDGLEEDNSEMDEAEEGKNDDEADKDDDEEDEDNTEGMNQAKSEDDEYAAIKRELADMPLEDLMKLKERLGLKVFNKIMHGDKFVEKPKQRVFKRVNKNRPMEMSSKRPVPVIRTIVAPKEKVRRDPRFDDLSGEYSDQHFNRNYAFLSDIKAREKQLIQKKLNKTMDEDKKKQLEQLLKRKEQEEKAEKHKKKKQELESTWKQKEKALIKEGKTPYFLKKADKKKLALAEKYKELQKAGKMDQYLSKKRKKNAQKERKKLPNLHTKF